MLMTQSSIMMPSVLRDVRNQQPATVPPSQNACDLGRSDPLGLPANPRPGLGLDLGKFGNLPAEGVRPLEGPRNQSTPPIESSGKYGQRGGRNLSKSRQT